MTENRSNVVTGDPLQENMELAEKLATLTAPDDRRQQTLVFAALVNVLDRFARPDADSALQQVRSVLLTGGEPANTPKARRRAAVGTPSGAPADSLYSDPVFLENARKLVGDRDRIVGGVATGDYNDCVAVGSSGKWCCSGTLVAPNVVVTAGHCDAGGCNGRILVGEQVDVPGTQIVRVKNAVSHPDYLNPNTTSDLCVLILEKDVTGVEPRRMASAAMLNGASYVRLVGYGNVDTSGTTGYGRRRLVDVPLASNSPDFGSDPAIEFVAGAPFLDRDSCNGDSGGPAYVKSGGQWYLLGATSRATASSFRRCGDGGIYSLIPAFAEWIRSVPGGNWS